MYIDSVDKVFCSYIAGVCDEDVHWKGKVFHPHTLRVSDGLFRGFSCPANCAGCCPRFSLDYLPFEERSDSPHIQSRVIEVNGKEKLIYSDLQDDHSSHFCRYVNQEGRCCIHGLQPFTCDFELIRFSISSSQDRANQLNQRMFGRGWSFQTVDGARGAKCSITSTSFDTVVDAIRKLERLNQWCEYFEIRTCLPTIIEQAKTNLPSFPILLEFRDGVRVIRKRGVHHGLF
jgi:hypothetical protein